MVNHTILHTGSVSLHCFHRTFDATTAEDLPMQFRTTMVPAVTLWKQPTSLP